MVTSGTARREIGVRSSLYALSAAVRRLANLALLPLVLAWATPAELSRYGLLLSALSIGIPLLSLNLHLAPARLYFDHGEPRRRPDLLTTVLSAALGQAAVAAGVGMLVLEAAGLADPASAGSAAVRLAFAGAILGSIALEASLVLMKVQGRAGVHAVTEGVQAAGLLVGYLAFHLLLADEVAALALAHLLAVAVAGGAGLAWALPKMRGGRPSVPLYREALAFSAPTVLHVTTLWLVASGGRWIGSAFVPLDELALYTLLTFAIALVGMLSRSLVEARLPEIGSAFAAADFDTGLHHIRRACAAAAVGVVAVYATGIAALPWVSPWLPAGYRPDPVVLVLACAGNLFDVLYLRSAQVLSALKRTGAQSKATVVAALLFVPLALAAASRLGATGLLAATAAGYALQAASTYLFAAPALAAARAGGGGRREADP